MTSVYMALRVQVMQKGVKMVLLKNHTKFGIAC